jgi:threonine aldolase
MEEAIIDLRSDTVTRPSQAMREAMARAPVGDDTYGEDPSVRQLEQRAAELTGKEAALFVPSGSMANLIAQLIYVRRGDEVLLGEASHVLFYEAGSGAALAGALYVVLPGGGLITAQQVAERIAEGSFSSPRTALVWIENSHNRASGAIYSIEAIEQIALACRQRQLPLHLDGARVFNASIASGRSVVEIAKPCDSLSFCLSKGLGAPIGSLLCGSHMFREQALRFRKMLGGAMRQAGVVAAAGLYALEHNIARLADDHRSARQLADGLASIPGITLTPESATTNIVIAEVPDAAALAARCRAHGVLIGAIARQRVRCVTHMDLPAGGIERAVEVLRAALHAF